MAHLQTHTYTLLLRVQMKINFWPRSGIKPSRGITPLYFLFQQHLCALCLASSIGRWSLTGNIAQIWWCVRLFLFPTGEKFVRLKTPSVFGIRDGVSRVLKGCFWTSPTLWFDLIWFDLIWFDLDHITKTIKNIYISLDLSSR